MGLDMWINKNGKEFFYWRKANAIHRFFVEEVQNGIDDCGEYNVSKDVIELLKDRCALILEMLDTCPKKEEEFVIGYSTDSNGNKVDILEKREIYDVPGEVALMLPTESGFFFGGVDYDEYYYQYVLDTKTMCDRLLLETDWDNDTVTYASSW